jgi:hypothetical protein
VPVLVFDTRFARAWLHFSICAYAFATPNSACAVTKRQHSTRLVLVTFPFSSRSLNRRWHTGHFVFFGRVYGLMRAPSQALDGLAASLIGTMNNYHPGLLLSSGCLVVGGYFFSATSSGASSVECATSLLSTYTHKPTHAAAPPRLGLYLPVPSRSKATLTSWP